MSAFVYGDEIGDDKMPPWPTSQVRRDGSRDLARNFPENDFEKIEHFCENSKTRCNCFNVYEVHV